MLIPHLRLLAALLLAVLIPALAADNVPLPFVSPIFGDNMILQRGKAVRFWGWAKPGEKISVELDGKSVSTVCGDDGEPKLVRPVQSGSHGDER